MAVCAQLMILVLSPQWRWLLLLWIHREVCCCTGRWQLDPQGCCRLLLMMTALLHSLRGGCCSPLLLARVVGESS